MHMSAGIRIEMYMCAELVSLKISKKKHVIYKKTPDFVVSCIPFGAGTCQRLTWFATSFRIRSTSSIAVGSSGSVRFGFRDGEFNFWAVGPESPHLQPAYCLFSQNSSRVCTPLHFRGSDYLDPSRTDPKCPGSIISLMLVPACGALAQRLYQKVVPLRKSGSTGQSHHSPQSLCQTGLYGTTD
eukprot:3838559-Rhodomonas_salina.1